MTVQDLPVTGIQVTSLPDFGETPPCQCNYYFPGEGYRRCGKPSGVRLRLKCLGGHDYTSFNCLECYHRWSRYGWIACRHCGEPLTNWSVT